MQRRLIPVHRAPAKMNLVFVFLALVAVSQGVPLERSFGGRIVNGEDAEVGEIPFQVSLQTSYGFHFCGGSVLTENYVVTAAHCVAGKEAENVKVIAGTVDLEKPHSIHYVKKIIIHADYDPSHSWSNDIAVLKVNEPFVVSKTIAYATLPMHSEEFAPGVVAVASGWGRLWEGGDTPTKLQRTDVKISSPEYCNKVNSDAGYPVYEGHICAHDPDVKTGPCHGDSGGPLVVDGKLVGLASWVISCASTKYPTVYTKVSQYVDWLEVNAV
ncbi:trypsin-1-like [Venturia canescens]|uniref:trypsin-1-like n=1 Tax=Venturia canescens TaxID=32260 RepID=UPI001C9C6004|nr:trypsin-1-like [Venturia canescens]